MPHAWVSSWSWLNIFQLTVDELLKTLDIHFTMKIKSPDYLVYMLYMGQYSIYSLQLLLRCGMVQAWVAKKLFNR